MGRRLFLIFSLFALLLGACSTGTSTELPSADTDAVNLNTVNSNTTDPTAVAEAERPDSDKPSTNSTVGSDESAAVAGTSITRAESTTSSTSTSISATTELVETTETPETEAETTESTTTTEPPALVASTKDEVSTSAAVQQPDREVLEQEWTAFASFGTVVLVHPSRRVESIGFHESNHDGARQLKILEGAINPFVLETRLRDTGSQTAADIVVDPDAEIRAPVTGVVLRAGGYILYCEHNDDFVVIEPDGQPGFELKVLHIDGVQVSQGDRVEAGVTILAPRPTPLPFDSQVDEFTAEPSWPHVHVELVDTSIPDRPSTGGGC